MIEGFLLGVIAMASATAGVFFLRFWRDTRDALFLAFAATFLIDAFSRTCVLFLSNPSEGHPLIYLVRLLTFVLLLSAIVKKNYSKAQAQAADRSGFQSRGHRDFGFEQF